MSVGDRIKEERKRLGFNQTQFAALAGVQISAQTNYETNKRVPDAAYLSAIFEVGADVQYIVAGVRAATVLHVEERLLLDRYRASGQPLRDAALRVLLGGTEAKSGGSTVIHGNVGPRIEGDLTLDTMTINMGNKYKK